MEGLHKEYIGNMILDDIIAVKRKEVAKAKQMNPLVELKAFVGDLPPLRNFRDSLLGHRCAIIAEIKRCSPSKGILKKDFDHRQIASIYEDNGAAAISVLTDRHFFGGDLNYLTDIRKIVHIPLLRKDFIFDAYQIYETKVIGGDALLLIAGILSENQLREFIQLSEELGLSALVEVHSESDLKKAIAAEANIIGINNRDLNTFFTDINISLNMASHVPPDKLLVSESGFHTRKDIEMLMNVGIHAFLIGETLMRAENIKEKIRYLLGRE